MTVPADPTRHSTAGHVPVPAERTRRSDGGIVWQGAVRLPTPAETEFAAILHAQQPGLQYWLHEDPDGIAWMLVSDRLPAGNTAAVLRLDLDATGMRGGWSPRQTGHNPVVRAEVAGVDSTPPEGISVPAAGATPAELARIAAAWFARHRTRWAARPHPRRPP